MRLLVLFTMLAATAIASSAEAQSGEAPGGQAGTAVIEVGVRPGLGIAYYDLDVPTALVLQDGGSSGVGHLGAYFGARHRGTGLGASLGWDHAFQGLWDHYGTHLFSLRVAQALPLFVGNDWGIDLRLEAGGGYFRGGATGSCGLDWGGTCVDEPSVNVEGGAFTSAVGLDFGVTGSFHAGFEVDYRYLIGVGSALAHEHQVLFLARVGFAFDV